MAITAHLKSLKAKLERTLAEHQVLNNAAQFIANTSARVNSSEWYYKTLRGSNGTLSSKPWGLVENMKHANNCLLLIKEIAMNWRDEGHRLPVHTDGFDAAYVIILIFAQFHDPHNPKAKIEGTLRNFRQQAGRLEQSHYTGPWPSQAYSMAPNQAVHGIVLGCANVLYEDLCESLKVAIRKAEAELASLKGPEPPVVEPEPPIDAKKVEELKGQLRDCTEVAKERLKQLAEERKRREEESGKAQKALEEVENCKGLLKLAGSKNAGQQAELERLSKAISEREVQIADALAKLSACESKAKEEAAALNERIRELTAGQHDELEKLRKALGDRDEQISEELAKLSACESREKAEVAELNEQIRNLVAGQKKELEKLNKTIADRDLQIAEVRAQASAAESEARSKEAALSEQVRTLTQQLEEIKNRPKPTFFGLSEPASAYLPGAYQATFDVLESNIYWRWAIEGPVEGHHLVSGPEVEQVLREALLKCSAVRITRAV